MTPTGSTQINTCPGTETIEREVPNTNCPVSPVRQVALRVLGFGLIAFGVGALFVVTHALLPIALITLGVAALFFGFTPPPSISPPPSQDLVEEKAAPSTPSFAFSDIDSSQTTYIPSSIHLQNRRGFLQANLPTPPPVIGKSPFVSNAMVKHLMTNKKNLALGVKYVSGDKITNMEGALHTFVTPVGPIMITGDIRWVGEPIGRAFEANFVRQVILSAAIHPDFEFECVIMPICKMEDAGVEGASLSEEEMDHLLQSVNRANEEERVVYDDKLRRHMIYHLTKDHRLPARDDRRVFRHFNSATAKSHLESLIRNINGEDIQERVSEMKVAVGRLEKANSETIIFFEVLLNLYIQQVRNEFRALNQNLPQGYVYTISPPVIFTRHIGGNAHLLNRLQAIAFKHLVATEFDLFTNLRVLAFDDHQDKSMIELYKEVFTGTDVRVIAFNDLYNTYEGSADPHYAGPNGLALVLHNNGDAFGQNIEFEGLSSMDGMIGSVSNAACLLRRDRPDLVENIL